MDSTQRTRPRGGGSPVPLVIFIILTVAFAVLAYWGFASWQKAQQRIAELDTQRKTAETNVQNMQKINRSFGDTAGVPTPENLKTYVDETLKVVQAEGFGSAAAASAKDALEAANATIGALKQTQGSLQAQIDTLNAQIKSLAEQKNASDTTYQSEVDARIAEISALTRKMNDEVARLQARINEEVAAREALREEIYNLTDTWKAQEAKYVLHVATLQEKLRRTTGEGAVIDKADAIITDIDRPNKLVTIGIGASNGVKPQMRFIAFTRNADGTPIKKGVVEVVRAEPTVSVARIISVDENMSLGKGDSVYNLAGPEKKLFIFIGELKLIGLDRWKAIVAANGGEVVDKVQAGDTVADYLIYGTFDAQDPAANTAILEARDFGLKIMSEAELKELMGVK